MLKFLALSFALLFSTPSISRDFIPPQAFTFKDTIYMEITRIFPELYDYNYIPSLIEHESCITLRHRRCWSPTSRLKSHREEGAGLGQLTRAFRPDGSIRFDSLTAMRNKHRQELYELSWNNVYQRPDLQIRTIVLMIRDLDRSLQRVPDAFQRLHMVNAAYNGGLRDVLSGRRACGMAANCNPNIWFGHLDRHCMKSRRALYGTRSACDINFAHTRDVFLNNLPKYQRYFFTGPRGRRN